MGKVIWLVSGILAAIVFWFAPFGADASSNQYDEVQIHFQSSDQTVLHGSLLLPDVPGPHPVVILIHGAGWHDREDYRAEAELFVNAGMAAFIYDKRTVGYSADGIGERSRSYSLLADDALAAVEVLSLRKELDPKLIGLWGLSEGSSVAPLAAVRSNDVAFVITVSASGVPPAQQTSWELENQLRQQGISANSFIHAMTRTGMRLLVSAGLFAEASYDHVPPLEQLQQPLLAIWGNHDRTAPPVESFLMMKAALERGDNEHVTFQFISNANHDLRLSPDGFMTSEVFAPGYADAMVSWIEEMKEGDVAGTSVIGNVPQQNYHSFAGISRTRWYDSAWSHLGMMIVLLVIFVGFYGMALIRFQRRRVTSVPNRLLWYGGATAASGIVSVLGLFGLFGYFMMTKEPGFIINGRPLPWLVLQFSSLVTLVFAGLLAGTWRKARPSTDLFEKIRLGSQLVGGILFVPWALYWKLLFPLM